MVYHLDVIAFCLVLLAAILFAVIQRIEKRNREKREIIKHLKNKADRLSRAAQGLPPTFPESRKVVEGEFPEKPASFYGID